MDWKFVADILLHIGIISSLIVVLFFTYTVSVEKEVVRERLSSIITSFSDTIYIFVPNNLLDYITHVKITPPDLHIEDEKIDQYNRELEFKAGVMIGSLLILSIIVAFWLSKKYEFSFKHLLLENLIIGGFVLATELYFFHFVASKYIPIDENFIKKTVVQSLINFTNQNDENENHI